MKNSLLIVCCLSVACTSGPSPTPAPEPTVFAMNANLSGGVPYSDYTTEYMAIRATGAKGAQTAAPWSSLNPTGSTFDLTPLTNPYFGINALTSYGFEAIFLNIPIIAIDSRKMPADISTLDFDNPVVLARFRAMIDQIKDQLTDKVKYLMLGNEVDTYFSTHTSEWSAYRVLVEDAREYLRVLKPNLKVGVTTTFQGATQTFASSVQTLNTNMDVFAITYYPTSGSFVPRDPGTVVPDIAAMVLASHGKPIVVQEWGYPSSSSLGSNEVKQAEFYTQSLSNLALQPNRKFLFVSFFKYRDWDTAYVQTLTGQTAGGSFFEFMSSLGLKRNDGVAKPALNVVVQGMN